MTFFPEKLLSHILQTMLQKGSFPLNWITPASIEFPGILVFLKAERNMLHILALQSAVLLFGGKRSIYLFIFFFLPRLPMCLLVHRFNWGNVFLLLRIMQPNMKKLNRNCGQHKESVCAMSQVKGTHPTWGAWVTDVRLRLVSQRTSAIPCCFEWYLIKVHCKTMIAVYICSVNVYYEGPAAASDERLCTCTAALALNNIYTMNISGWHGLCCATEASGALLCLVLKNS